MWVGFKRAPITRCGFVASLCCLLGVSTFVRLPVAHSCTVLHRRLQLLKMPSSAAQPFLHRSAVVQAHPPGRIVKKVEACMCSGGLFYSSTAPTRADGLLCSGPFGFL